MIEGQRFFSGIVKKIFHSNVSKSKLQRFFINAKNIIKNLGTKNIRKIK